MFTSYHKVKIFPYILQITETYLPQQNQGVQRLKLLKAIFKSFFNFLFLWFEALKEGKFHLMNIFNLKAQHR